MMKKLVPFFLLLSSVAWGQKSASPECRLVVGIVVDQMRNDFIYRYWDRFGDGGIKRLVRDGYHFRNAHFNYIPTFTGPGHASIYTGATPRAHGIIANEWFVKHNRSEMYCTMDTAVRPVGSGEFRHRQSPRNMLASTLTDELKISSPASKVFAFALKDRGSILPAGHAANGAFWFDDATGAFITSDWYMRQLPRWLNEFNAKNLARAYLEKGWTTLYPISSYSASLPDENPYEARVLNEKSSFPYDFKKFLEKNMVGAVRYTPFGNSLTLDAALECLKQEQLGKDRHADVLAISFSSSDVVAHSYGPRAAEVEDLYLRLDKDIERLLKTLDQMVGLNNYVVFLTADHGGADVPNHLKENRIPAGLVKEGDIKRRLKEFLTTTYGDTLLFLNMSNDQIFLDEKKIADMKLERRDVETRICDWITSLEGVAEAFPSREMKFAEGSANNNRVLLRNGYNHKLSGNICLIYQPGWIDYAEQGTTHGSGYNYDTHVPVIFFGNGIRKGESTGYVTITQVAPTICELLRINQPNSCSAEPLKELMK